MFQNYEVSNCQKHKTRFVVIFLVNIFLIIREKKIDVLAIKANYVKNFCIYSAYDKLFMMIFSYLDRYSLLFHFTAFIIFCVPCENVFAQKEEVTLQQKTWDFNLSEGVDFLFDLEKSPTKSFDVLDWAEINKIPDGSIETCTPIDLASESWRYTEKHKAAKTKIMLVSGFETRYPCRYMWEHLQRFKFGMSSLEDVPLPILKKFTYPKMIFYRKDIFYDWYFYSGLASNRIKHEEMHILQYEHNPNLERYMWNEAKTKLTNFGEFIEGCTESHFPTAGFLNYSPYIQRYHQILEFGINTNRKKLVHKACLGNYDAFWDLNLSMGSILR